jgi:predicted acetyltransferase
VDFDIANPIPAEEARGFVHAIASGLLGNPYDSDFERRVQRWERSWTPERTWGFKEHGRWVATLATSARRLSVPGPDGATNDLLVDAVTGVTVAATHRRQGLLTQMITRSLAFAKERGEPLSMLIAAEWPIYGRYGYAPAVWTSSYVYRPRVTASAVAPKGTGRMRQVEAVELFEHAVDIFEAFRRGRHGQVDRSNDWWARRLGLDGYEPMSSNRSHWLLHEGPDGPDGLLSWKVGREFDLDGTLGSIEVEGLFATNDGAYQDMYAYLSGIDAIDEITLPYFAVDEQLRWLIRDGRALRQGFTGDLLWIRLLDVPVALAARTYSVPGRLVLDVIDDEPGSYGAGRVLLEAADGAATCLPTTLAGDLRLSQRALASAYLGGQSLRGLAMGGGVEELRAGALALADAMFCTPLAPSNATGF